MKSYYISTYQQQWKSWWLSNSGEEMEEDFTVLPDSLRRDWTQAYFEEKARICDLQITKEALEELYQNAMKFAKVNTDNSFIFA